MQDHCGSYVDRGHRWEESETLLKLRLPFAAVTQRPLPSVGQSAVHSTTIGGGIQAETSGSQPRAWRMPGYGLEAHSAIGIGIQAEMEHSDVSACFFNFCTCAFISQFISIATCTFDMCK